MISGIMIININSKILVTDDLNYKCTDSMVLYIKKGAFGSGEHETTKACLNFMSNMDFRGKTVLDIGCGTGILTIAADKLGAKSSLGFDPFFSACITAKVNFQINKTKNTNVICSYNDAVDGVFDIILANIYSDILIDLKNYINKSIKLNGILIMSGIPFSENFDVRNNYEKLGFELIKNSFHEEYTTVVMKKAVNR
jgi:ribosomal protein L11 methyltransferase